MYEKLLIDVWHAFHGAKRGIEKCDGGWSEVEIMQSCSVHVEKSLRRRGKLINAPQRHKLCVCTHKVLFSNALIIDSSTVSTNARKATERRAGRVGQQKSFGFVIIVRRHKDFYDVSCSCALSMFSKIKIKAGERQGRQGCMLITVLRGNKGCTNTLPVLERPMQFRLSNCVWNLIKWQVLNSRTSSQVVRCGCSLEIC